jgi:hypothetical protein
VRQPAYGVEHRHPLRGHAKPSLTEHLLVLLVVRGCGHTVSQSHLLE